MNSNTPTHLCAALAITAMAATACTDNHTLTPGTQPTTDLATAIEFSAVADDADAETRADATLVNKSETWLPATNGTTGTPRVGLFGYYTGTNSWNALQTLCNTAFADRATLETTEFASLASLASKDEYNQAKNTQLAAHYTANTFYNTPLTIEEVEESAISSQTPPTGTMTNALSYTDKRYWPNDGGKMSFWAYYPWTATATTAAAAGIYIDPAVIAAGAGMGSIRFNMEEYARNQVDFLISDLVTDKTKANYPLTDENGVGGAAISSQPSRVPLRFRHALAQVRLYSHVSYTPKITYERTPLTGEFVLATGDETFTVNGADGKTSATYTDADGNTQTIKNVAGEPKIKEVTTWGNGAKTVELAFNNINTDAIFTPSWSNTGGTAITSSVTGALGSAKVDGYIENPYWFYHPGHADNGKKINTDFMYESIEAQESTYDLDGSKLADGDEKTKRVATYSAFLAAAEKKSDTYHYNFAPSNIIMAVPQHLKDDNVPNVTITVSCGTQTARVTVNLVGMNIKWESGFIYCYAFVDELAPGDDIVRGPESITVLFDPLRWTDQW